MNSQAIKELLLKVSADIDQLPVAAVQLVGALIALQSGLPPLISQFIMYRLEQRADMSEVSPAAEAVMRLQEYSRFREMEFAKSEMRAQLDLIKALALEDKVLVAANFLGRLAENLAIAVAPSDERAPELGFGTIKVIRRSDFVGQTK